MAASSSTNNTATTSAPRYIVLPKDDSDLVELSRCCVCYETYDDGNKVPIAVPCGHTFCQMCVGMLTYDAAFFCGVCRTVSIIPAAGLKKNMAHIQMLECLGMLVKDTTPLQSMVKRDLNIPEHVMTSIKSENLHKSVQNHLDLLRKYLTYMVDSKSVLNYMESSTEALQAIRDTTNVMKSLEKSFNALQVAASEELTIPETDNVPRGRVDFSSGVPAFLPPGTVRRMAIGMLPGNQVGQSSQQNRRQRQNHRLPQRRSGWDLQRHWSF